MALSAEPQSYNSQQNKAIFSLKKVTKEITKIIKLQSLGKKLSLKVSYASNDLKFSALYGDSIKY